MSGRIELLNVAKSYGAKAIVADCSFTIEAGKTTVMIGPSGVGKSTLMRLLAGFERPTSGDILIDGRSVRGPGPDRLVVFQESALFPWMTTAENVLFGPKVRRQDRKQSKARTQDILARVGLSAFCKKYPAQLSGGMQRRAELARAMVNDPAIIILDEPFRGLDAMTRNLMLEYYAELTQASGQTSFFITTDIDEAIFLADRLLIMSNIPTRPRTLIEVALPHPRKIAALIDDDRANAIKIEALSILHEEAMKSFIGGSRAASDLIEAYARRNNERALLSSLGE